MFEEIIKEIEKAPIITIYPHVSADGDAMGSCFGMKELIKGKYPEKEVYVLGQPHVDAGNYFPNYDEVSDEKIAASLALSLDTADLIRCDVQKINLAKMIIKIDHHPNVDPFGAIRHVDTTKSSCCEIIVELGKEMYGEERFPVLAAKWLYSGLFTDTMGFTTSSANSNSLKTGAYLANYGLNLNEIAYYFNSRDINGFNYVSKVRGLANIDGKFLYAVVHKEDYQSCGVPFDQATGCVGEFSKIRGLKIWAVFFESDREEDEHKYVVSLRSRDCTVNDIASLHHGGGHPVAAGCKIFTDEELEVILKELNERANG